MAVVRRKVYEQYVVNLGQIIGQKRLQACVVAHVRPDDAIADGSWYPSQLNVIVEYVLTVIALYHNIVQATKLKPQVICISSEQHRAAFIMPDEKAVWFRSIMLYLEWDYLEVSHAHPFPGRNNLCKVASLYVQRLCRSIRADDRNTV